MRARRLSVAMKERAQCRQEPVALHGDENVDARARPLTP
jgi:hypothetical protein